MGRPFTAAFDTGTYGNSYDLADARQAWHCWYGELKDGNVISDDNLREISNFMQNHHKYVSRKLDEHGRIPYDFYPHHIWSNPFAFDDFKMLDKRQITNYRYIVESGCTKNFEADRRIDVVAKWSHDVQFSSR